MTSADDRYLTLCTRGNRTATPTHLRYSLSAITGRLVSTSTVRRRLHEGCLYERRPVICVPLTSRHRKYHLQWACQHIYWTLDQRRAVLFTIESSFSLESKRRRYLIWRVPGTCYHSSNMRERDAYEEVVPVFEVASLCLDAQTSTSFQGEP